jgi:hypothetical protein
MPTRDKIFVSYSHKDARLVEEFQTMLAPALQKGLVDLWVDTKIPPGAKWQEEIEKGLASAKIAVLLVSQNFLASRFITENELPPLLSAAQKDGVIIFWIYLSSCLYEQTEVASYQAAHDVSRPLDRLPKAQRQAVLSETCAKLILAARQVGDPNKRATSSTPPTYAASTQPTTVSGGAAAVAPAEANPVAQGAATLPAGSTGADVFRETLLRYVAEAPAKFASLGANTDGNWSPTVWFPDAIRCSGGGPSDSPFIECVLFRSKERAAAEARFTEIIAKVEAALPGWTRKDIGQFGTPRRYFSDQPTVRESSVSVDTTILEWGTDFNVFLAVQCIRSW